MATKAFTATRRPRRESASDDWNAAQVGSFVAHAAWVTALSWSAVGNCLVLATGCSEGSVRLYTALYSALAALPDLQPAPVPEDQDPAAAEPQAGGDQTAMLMQTSSSATLQADAAIAGVSDAAADEQMPLPPLQLMTVAVTADLRGVTCIDLRVSTDSSTGEDFANCPTWHNEEDENTIMHICTA